MIWKELFCFEYIFIYSIKRNRETCSSHLRAFSRTAFPKNPGYFGKLVWTAPGRCNRFIFPTDRLPEIFQIFRESGPGIAATHHFLKIFRIFQGPFSRNIPNISGKATVEISGIFRKNCLECDCRNIRDISEKWSGL